MASSRQQRQEGMQRKTLNIITVPIALQRRSICWWPYRQTNYMAPVKNAGCTPQRVFAADFAPLALKIQQLLRKRHTQVTYSNQLLHLM